MPYRKPVRTLKEACLYNISKNMDKYWCKDYQEIFLGQGQFIYIDGPFDYLPGSLVNEIIQTLKREQLLHGHHLHLLITSNLERLDLSKETIDLRPILNMISFRCKDLLKELSLAHCSRIPKVGLKDMIVTLNNLEVLDLSWASVHDDVLGTVGSSCPKLRELNVSVSHYVSDRGIRYLCVDDSPNNGEQRFGKCKLLTRLLVQDTKVSASGVETALRNLPNLQCLNHPEVVSVLDTMHRTDWEVGIPIPPYCLRSLFADYRLSGHSPSTKSCGRSLSVATDVCPYTTDVHLLAYRYRDCPDALISLSKLKFLKVLNITVDDTSEDDCSGELDLFSNSVIPVLQTRGQYITTLSLGEFPPGVDIGIIGMCCPLLEDFSIAFNKGYVNNSQKLYGPSSSHVKPFSSLKKLAIVCVCSNIMVFKDLRQQNQQRDGFNWAAIDIPPSHLKDLLSSPVLETVFIRESLVLTDALMRDVLSSGQKFCHLRELELEQCHNLTVDLINSVIHLSGPLKSIKVWECKLVTRSDFNSLKSMSKRNKWDLRIDWM